MQIYWMELSTSCATLLLELGKSRMTRTRGDIENNDDRLLPSYLQY